jgi:hypothetical protein
LVPEGERKEQANPADYETAHDGGCDIDKYSVMTSAPVPIRIGTNTLAVHPPGTTEVAGGIETGDGGVMDSDFTGEYGARINWN